jgi:hypothetical protein
MMIAKARMLKFYKNIYTNQYFQFSMLIAVIGGLISDQYGVGYSYVFSLVLLGLITAFLSEKKRYQIYSRETIPIPIVIKVDDGTYTANAFRSLIKAIEIEDKFENLEENLKKYFSITRDELIFEYKGNLFDEKKLISFFQIIRYELNRIENRLDNRVIFHLSYYRRPAIGFMIGTIFRTDGVVVYQRADANDIFNPIAKIDSRRYKERIENFEKFHIDKQIIGSDKVVIVIDAASHKVDYKHEIDNQTTSIIHLTAKNNGTIGLDEDWVRYAQEIYRILNEAQVVFKKIKILHAMPEALAVIVGMAIENYWPIEITQYDNGTYPTVMSMNQYKYYF